jgi:signal transduction histidine kinase
MNALRIPVSVWTWRGTTLVLVVMLAPLLATLSPDRHVLTTAAEDRGLLVGTATLAAATYLHWRITGDEATGWLALLLAAAAGPDLALGAFTLAHHDTVQAQSGWLFVFHVAILVGMLAALLASRVAPLPSDPLTLGLVLGLGVACVRHVLLVEAPALPTPAALAPVRALVLITLAAVLAGLVLQLTELPRWIRSRVAVGLLLVGLGSVATGVVALATAVAGAVLMAGTAAALLHQAIEQGKQLTEDLNLRLQAVEGGLRGDRARLHEINATVAGIASAQKLMAEGLTADRSDALAAMMRAEVERLQRLVAHRAPSRQRSVDLDETIGQIVLSHLARGRVVLWEPTGLRALGRADEIAEVINVLLENAAVHGGPDAVTVRVTRDPGSPGVTVTVADQGPGVAPELRERLFDWGVSRPDSPGQGIGLHVAADIARALGGVLELLPTPTGATFALRLATAPQEVSAGEPVARAG